MKSLAVNMYIPILLGTARKGRRSEHVAKWLLGKIEQAGHKTGLIDVRDYRLEATDNTGEPLEAKKWAKLVKEVDGLIIVSPEYNHSYPGELKMMLDMLYSEYKGLPVGTCAVSEGNFGGARVVEGLIPLYVNFGMVPAQYPLNVFVVNETFSAEGGLSDESYNKKCDKFLDSLTEHIQKYKR